MKRKLFIINFVFLMSVNCFAQLMVVDIQAIASSIQNGITMGNQLTAAYNQLKSTYNQIENQIKMMQSMDLNSIGNSLLNGLSKNSREYLSLMENLENTYKTKNMKIGNVEFSLEDICTTNVYEAIKNDFGEIRNVQNLNDEQKMEFFKKYGISYEQFVKLYALSQEMGDKSKEIKAKSVGATETVKDLVEMADRISSTITDETSQTAVLQKNALVASQTLNAMSQTLDVVSNISDLLATQYQNEMIRQQEEVEADLARKELTRSSDYTKNSVGQDSDYYGFGRKK